MNKNPFNPSLQHIIADDGLLLPSLHYLSQGSSKTKLLVYVHGAGSSSIIRNQRMVNALADGITSTGTDLLLFQNRGAGYITKFDTVGGASVLAGMTYEKMADFIYDIKGVYNWALTKGYTDIYVAGHSTGANKLALNAEWLNGMTGIKGVALIAGGDDISLQHKAFGGAAHAMMRESLRKVDRGQGGELVPMEQLAWNHPISWQSLLELLKPGGDYDMFPFGRYDKSNTSLFRHISLLQKRTVAIYGSEDYGTVISPHQAVKIVKERNLKIEIALVDGADHNFTDKETDLVVALISGLGLHD